MALITTPPSSQKAGDRPIALVLVDNNTRIDSVSLVVRPEDLTRSEPSRMSVTQTLGTGKDVAWVDNFGPGLPQITIAGHTGWRNTAGDGDGVAKFKQLHKIGFHDWHNKTKQAVKAGRDPSEIKLIFADALDNFTYVVTPLNFTLRRSKARPLLMQYNISFQAIDTSVDSVRSIFTSFAPDLLAELGLESLGDVLDMISGAAQEITDFIGGTLGVAAKEFLLMTQKVLGVVNRVVGTVKGAIDSVSGAFLSVARDLMQAGGNLFRSVTEIMSLPAYAKFRVMQIIGAYSNAFCLLTNVFKRRRVFPDYRDWYGASNCSSTAGGSPLSPLRHINAFPLLNSTQTTNYINVSAPAALAMNTANSVDPVLSPPNYETTRGMMNDISAGVTAG